MLPSDRLIDQRVLVYHGSKAWCEVLRVLLALFCRSQNFLGGLDFKRLPKTKPSIYSTLIAEDTQSSSNPPLLDLSF